ncbi:MAG: hypothetical protein M1829_000496 [Trizodia sp. TS-e1964]|nr:MAG: hypothetical protein M1829_000496 [Trizodia sp. TS-e1964]
MAQDTMSKKKLAMVSIYLENASATAPESKYAFNETVTILVGPERCKFLVHKDVLVRKSPYFKAAFDGAFKEADSGTLSLPEDDVETFRRFISYIYSGLILSDNLYKYAYLHSTPNILLEFVRLYILADKFQMPRMKNEVIDAIREVHLESVNLEIHVEAFRLAYENTLRSSPLRKVLAFLFCLALQSHNDIEAYRDSWPLDFWVDTSKIMCMMLGLSDGWENLQEIGATSSTVSIGSCSFHEHLPGDNYCKGPKQGKGAWKGYLSEI